MVDISSDKDKITVKVTGEMTIYTASEIMQKLVTVADDEKKLECNVSAVTEIDSAGVQLLMLLKKERQRKGLEMSLTSHSDVVVEIFDLMGLTPYFKDPVLMTSS